MHAVLGAGATLGPVAVAGDAAVAPWQAGGEAGRAFLRHGPEGWHITVLSGESLRLPATYRGLGLSPRIAADLAAQVALVERPLPAAQRAAHDSFAGTLFPPEG
ncbi:MAG: copper uptake system-associated protein [Rhodobacteraceae bacterium]|nr:copper uptake system-associated protein [Paracoccaceae bacterium]